MNSTEPQFLYMVLILPSLFGFTLVGEGMNKIMKEEAIGWVSVVMGATFIAVVVVAYLFLAGKI
jgi:hypothetical protein